MYNVVKWSLRVNCVQYEPLKIPIAIYIFYIIQKTCCCYNWQSYVRGHFCSFIMENRRCQYFSWFFVFTRHETSNTLFSSPLPFCVGMNIQVSHGSSPSLIVWLCFAGVFWDSDFFLGASSKRKFCLCKPKGKFWTFLKFNHCTLIRTIKRLFLS